MATDGGLPLRRRASYAVSALLRGLQNPMSEDQTTSRWHPFSAPLDPGTPLTPESFAACARVPAGRSVDVRPLDAFLGNVQDPASVPDADEREAYRLVGIALTALLDGGVLVAVGEGQVVDVATYLVGRLADGSVAGVVARTIET